MFASVEVRDPDRRCRHCKYSLEGLGGGGGLKCPECGSVVSDDDLLGVRRFSGPGTEFLWACCVPLLGACITGVAAALFAFFDDDVYWLEKTLVYAVLTLGATVLSGVIGAVVYMIRATRAPVACRLLITNRCLAAVFGHIVIGLAMVAWIWRCLQAFANV